MDITTALNSALGREWKKGSESDYYHTSTSYKKFGEMFEGIFNLMPLS